MARISYHRATGGETKKTVDYDSMEISDSVVWIRKEDGGMKIIPLGNVNFIEVDEDELESERSEATESTERSVSSDEADDRNGETAD